MNDPVIQYVVTMMRGPRARRRDQRGASAVEYGLLIAGIAAIIVVAVFAFGGGARGLFHGSCDDIIARQSLGSCP